MNAIHLLASSLNQRNDIPNQQLADKIIYEKRYEWIAELVGHLKNPDKNIQSDSIKVLYEIGLRGSAEMIAPYFEEFVKLLESKNNRMVWGAMCALDTITAVQPGEIFKHLEAILKAIDKGSVITIDGGVSVLAQIAALKEYNEFVFPLLLEQLQKCPAKQLPQYAEKTVKAVNHQNKNSFLKLIEQRFHELTSESQKKRLTKVIRKLS